LYKYGRVVIVIKVRGSGEIIGAYNPFGWGTGLIKYIGIKLFKDIMSQYFIFSLTNKANPILSYHKKGTMSKISNEGHILFGKSDLSVNGSVCTSEQHSFKKKIIDKEWFEMAELEVFRVTNKNIGVTLRRNLLFVLFRSFILVYLMEMIIYVCIFKANGWTCTSAFRFCF